MKLNKDWAEVLDAALSSPEMAAIKKFLHAEKKAGKIIYPPEDDIFAAFNATPFKNVEVVILGQDPYHGPDQAHGLSFSVRDGLRLPPSLKNIYKEIVLEYGAPLPESGDLTRWAKQGVLLLNATLTVEAAQAGSHQKRGWEDFTDAVIRDINDRLDHVVFMLWGSYAQKKGAFIDRARHLVLEAPHPSPLSAHRGFLGCGHFKAANDYLVKHGRKPILWTE